jgi:cysteine sulfinate desulfinase/cysteine desulfurase-like protein
MLPWLTEKYGNPSSLYPIGQEAKEALEDARARCAAVLGANPREITFTSGGSEADNQAIVSAARLGARKGKKHLISTKFEHHAVLHTLAKLEKEGYEVTLLDVHEDGVVRLEDLEAAIRPDTALVTVMFANNEIGTVQPIAEIGALCRAKGSAVIEVRKGSVDGPIAATIALSDTKGEFMDFSAAVSGIGAETCDPYFVFVKSAAGTEFASYRFAR